MWTLYQGKLQTVKFDSSDPKKDKENFQNLIKDLNKKFEEAKSGTVHAHINVRGDLVVSSENDTTITFTKEGAIDVSIPAA